MRSFIRFAVDKPIINHIFMVFMVLLALISYRNIAKEIFPPSALDVISIQGGYVGASATILDKMVVTSIEDEVKSLPEVDVINTTIQNGSFTISVEIKTGEDPQVVLDDVKDIIAKTKRDLPSDMDEPIARVSVQNYPLLLVAVSGDVSKKALIDAGDDLKSHLASLKDLSTIDLRGDTDEEVLVTIDQKRLDAYGIEKRSLYQAISTLSTIFPAGTIDAQGDHLYISTISGAKSAEDLGNTLLRLGGVQIRLKDVADIYYGLGEPTQVSHYNGKENISLNINKSKEGNAIALSREIRKILEEYNNKYEDINFRAYTDTSVWIKNRLNLVSSNILFGLILVFMALLLSVNARIALVVAIGIPASFMIALIFADTIGYSLNMLTLLGALIALGMLVDEAIVVAENIYRHMEMGKAPREAAIEGAVEMFPAVLTATLTTVFAFLPLLMMSGKMGVFMQVLPVMISVLLISSLFEAFYFLPLHAKEFFSMGKIKPEHHNGGFWQGAIRGYQRLLKFLLRFKKISLTLIVGAIIWATMSVASVTKFQLFPEFDAQQIYMTGAIDINNNLAQTEAYVTEIEEALLAMLDKQSVDSVTSVIGLKVNRDQSFELGENLFQIFINLHEKAPDNFFDRYINPIFSLEYDGSNMIRHRFSQEISKEIEQKVGVEFRAKEINGKPLFEELNIYVQQAGIVSNDIDIGVEHPDRATMLHALNRVKRKLATIDGVEDIGDNANEGERELKLRVNRYGQSLGFDEALVTSTLRGAFLKSEYAKMFNEEGLVRLKIEDAYKESIQDLPQFQLTTPDGQQRVKLVDICDFTYQKSFVKIFKEDGEKVRSLFARVEKKIITPVEVMEQIKPLLDELESEGIKLIIKGEEKENAKLKKEMSEALVVAVFLIFITLVWMFNSLVMPLIVLSIIPLSLFGALAGSYLMGINMTMPGMMGVIGLAGVVVNDGLIMVDFIKGHKNHHNLALRASMRLRPIMLTSITTVLGLSSLIFFASGQALILQPMAISLGFGVAWATVLNLFYVPLLYAVIYRVKG
jgi:HAE1 family hydrophobic/amphiphilic exporter-1